MASTRVGAALDSAEHPWTRLCDFAWCSPDVDVVYHFDRTQAVAWLKARLARYGHEVTHETIEAAYDLWPPTP